MPSNWLPWQMRNPKSWRLGDVVDFFLTSGTAGKSSSSMEKEWKMEASSRGISGFHARY